MPGGSVIIAVHPACATWGADGRITHSECPGYTGPQKNPCECLCHPSPIMIPRPEQVW